VPTQSTSSVPKDDLQLEIAHLLLIDIVGYSKLLVNEQIEAVEELNRIARNTECFRTAEAKGRLIRIPTGDGMILLFFSNPEEPARCALEITQNLKKTANFCVRMGIHSGPVNTVKDVNDNLNVAGTGINVAQRVMDCGDSGHILLSKHIADDLAEYRHWQPHLHDLGEYEVKHGLRLSIVNLCKDDLGNPQIPKKLQRRRASKSALITFLVLAALITGLILFRFWSSHSSSGTANFVSEKSIAVLPFENRSEETANAYFADGIQDEILTRLAKISDLKVISRTSTQHYKSAPENLREIAKQLRVAHVVEGSVQKSGDTVRVNVQLINAKTDTHIWADTFDRKLTDILSVESEVAKAIADQLRVKISGREKELLTTKPTQNPEAYDAYLRGLAYTLKTGNTPANSIRAQEYLREAVRLDPKFARGWALLSQVDARGFLTLNLQQTASLREEARQAAETALNLEPNLGEALYSKGYYHYACLKDYDTAANYFEQARQLLPNSSRIDESLAYVARRKGKWDTSESYFNQAEELDPRNVYVLTQHAFSNFARRRFPQARAKLDQVLNITPDDTDTIAVKAAIFQAEGDLTRASALLTPLHPSADDTSAVETQVYQAILERRSAQIIPRLKEIVAKPDPALGHWNGELLFWLGWAQDVAGDHNAAQESWQLARSRLEPFLKEQPDNDVLLGDLALIDMSLGEDAAALALAKRAMAVNPVEQDALTGPTPIEILARTEAHSGKSDRAIAALERLLSIPYEGALASGIPLTPALLRLDPMFDPLRNDPRFKRLIAPGSSKP
jgi:TolB-like protein/class 3 adenylate cyclase/Tfp pilus assembly protein PilF